jgi:phosphopantothenoylcysteine synthetase/decarboxylase
MNTFMWNSYFTKIHLNLLKDIGFDIIDPISKKLECNDIGLFYFLIKGMGALANVDTIIDKMIDKINKI